MRSAPYRIRSTTLVLTPSVHFRFVRRWVILHILEDVMNRHGVYEFDNRDSAEVYQYMEARIEALKRLILELEAEKEALPCTVAA